MAKANVIFKAESPTTTGDESIATRASRGSNTANWEQSTSGRKPTHKAAGTNAKLDPTRTSTLFDEDILILATPEQATATETWVWVFAWVDGDYTSDGTLASESGSPYPHLVIGAGGTSIKWQSSSSREGEKTAATNNTDNSSTNYTFGSDVEVLILTHAATSQVLNFYNIDGDLIAVSDETNNGLEWDIDQIGAGNSGSGVVEFFSGELLAAEFYMDVTLPTSSQLIAIGNVYKNMMN
jgi:hypothetical protein